MHKKINPLLQVKPLSAYPKNLLQTIKMISFDPNKNAEPFGSYIYRLQRYSADVDLFEEYVDNARPNELVHKFAERLKSMVRNIQKTPLHWFSEFKAGLDFRYDISIGDLLVGVWINRPNIMKIAHNLLKEGLFNTKEVEKIHDAVHNKKYSQADAYDIVFNVLRNRRIIRWTADEILEGRKTILGRLFKLHDCLFDHTFIKIDIITYVDNRFTEVTNFIGLVSEYDFPNKNYININLDKNNDPKVSLPIEIEKLYFSNYYYSPFKACKRMYSYGRQLNIKSLLKKVIPIVTGDISALYMLKSQLDVIARLMEIVPKNEIPIDLIFKSIDDMKDKLSYVLFLSEKGINESYAIMDKLTNDNHKMALDHFIRVLNFLSNKWFVSINYETIKQMQKRYLNPPPNDVLPNPMHYRYLKRNPLDNPNIK
jgi:hypothetical protein